MGILFGSEKRASWIGEPPVPPYPGGSGYGAGSSLGSSADAALVIPTVWACVNLLANSVSMLPLETFRRTAGVPARIEDPTVVVSPAIGMTQSEWLHMLMVSLLLRGNAYARVVGRDALQRPTQLEPLNPDMVHVTVDKTTGDVTYKLGPMRKDVPTADIWHVRGMTMPGAKVGLSPISYAAAVLGVDLHSRQFADDFFRDGGVPKAILTTAHPVAQDAARTIKDRFMAATRSREPAVLSQGLTYSAVSVNPEESQFLLTQQANVGQITRYFGIAPEMVGGSSGGNLAYSSPEMRSIEFLTYGVSFWLKRLEDAVFPLLPEPEFVRFNTRALLRTDAETQAKIDVQLVAGKIKVPSEVRFERDMPPMTSDQKAEADMVPLTITPNGSAKALPALKEPPGPTASVPADDQADT